VTALTPSTPPICSALVMNANCQPRVCDALSGVTDAHFRPLTNPLSAGQTTQERRRGGLPVNVGIFDNAKVSVLLLARVLTLTELGTLAAGPLPQKGLCGAQALGSSSQKTLTRNESP
jgi:hypothetical protein